MNANTRLGSVIRFREGVSKEEALAALRSIRDLIDLPEGYEMTRNPDGSVSYTKVPTRVKDVLHEYNPDHGNPIWYIP